MRKRGIHMRGGAWLVVSLLAATAAAAGDDGARRFQLDGGGRLEFESDQAFVPELVWEDTSRTGQPLESASVAGVSLGRRVLSGSRFTLRPDRLCVWEYDFGFRAFPSDKLRDSMDGKARLAATQYPWRKSLCDPLTPHRGRVWEYEFSLWLDATKSLTKVVYPPGLRQGLSSPGAGCLSRRLPS